MVWKHTNAITKHLTQRCVILDILVNTQTRHMIIFALSLRHLCFLLSHARLSVLAVLSACLHMFQLACSLLQLTQIVSHFL